MGVALLDTARSFIYQFMQIIYYPIHPLPANKLIHPGIWFLSLLRVSREGGKGRVREDGMENLLHNDKTEFLCSLQA